MQPSVFQKISTVRQPVFETPEDDNAYWQANPDIVGCGLSANEHYERYGRAEGRLQAVNQEEVAALRERKLGRLRFRRPPDVPRQSGSPACYLTDAIREEFRIPPFPPVSAHDYGDYITGLQQAHPGWMFLDVGAGLRDSVTAQMVNVDIFSALSTDVVCIGEDLPFEDAQFDFVLCAATLEHTLRPWEVAAEICRVLKPGGIVRIDYPFLQPVHGYPSHYFNATPEGNISLFSKWCDIQYNIVPEHFHPAFALRWMMEDWKNGLPDTLRETFGSMTVNEFLTMPLPELLSSEICTKLPDSVQKVLCAGSTLEAIKRPGEQYYGSGREQRLEQAMRQYRDDIRIITSSSSWKVTAPLRRAVGVMKKLLRRSG
ncbi:class I SAM-dependent methyltransferase [Acetobacter sp. AN02]|uniref:class I SAM-dependent methyltransferase n=1 Tax=Acetobacter sp. AN02 TaxID=2894186 RepID=UPI002434210F|nr:class I SAM-dependent methyltransferase [Acetobacter sp. AN02]MDG6094614.1 class I SAM-dependent methyltransferase [Acetobacter sp. AN02]